jgi:hypothetical protein
MQEQIAKPGDCIISEDAAENWQIFRLTPQRTASSIGLAAEREQAYRSARSEIESGGRVWIGDKETPETIAPY